MKIVLTVGPSSEPLDAVRRLTNLSTGELGTLLANAFSAAGHEVMCLRSTSSTFPPPSAPVKILPFHTNGDVEEHFYRIKNRQEIQAIFHLAALCDFRVRDIRDEKARPVNRDKISSRVGLLEVTLEPLPKILPILRNLFPASLIIGWKYEGHGTLTESLAKGRRQMTEDLTDLCVVNGPGYGHGFGVLSRSGGQVHLGNKPELVEFLTDWLNQTPTASFTQAQESFNALASLLPLGPFL